LTPTFFKICGIVFFAKYFLPFSIKVYLAVIEPLIVNPKPTAKTYYANQVGSPPPKQLIINILF